MPPKCPNDRSSYHVGGELVHLASVEEMSLEISPVSVQFLQACVRATKRVCTLFMAVCGSETIRRRLLDDEHARVDRNPQQAAQV